MMKRFMYLNFLVLALVFVGCSDDDSGGDNNGGSGNISDAPISGKLFGEDFVAKGFYGDANALGGEKLSIFLSSEEVGCETNKFSSLYTITIAGPQAEGYYTSDVFVNFSDPNSEGFESVGSGIEYEIISLSDTEVTAKISVSNENGDNLLEGKFTAPICPGEDEG